MPLIGFWILLLPVEVRIAKQEPDIHQLVPRHKHEIGVASLLANEIFIASFLEVVIDDTKHSLDFVPISLFRRCDIRIGVELRAWS